MSSNKKYGILVYELKKVGKFWLLGKSGGNFKKCPQLTHAKEVDINDNIIVADEILYEIKESEHGPYLAKVEEMPAYDEENRKSNNNTMRPIRPVREDEVNTDRFKESFLSSKDKTHLHSKYDKMKITDETGWRRKEGLYYIFEAGQTEDTSSLDDSVAGSKKGITRCNRSLRPSIDIIKDSLENVKVDAIACTTSHDFNLSRGAVSIALLKRGGEMLQRALYENSKGKNDFGDVIPVPGHGLYCKEVIFGAMYSYDPKFSKRYKSPEEYFRISIHDFMQRCLYLAENKELQSIAFPAIGTGSLNYPVNIVADEMFTTTDNWRGTYVKEVKFVIYPTDFTVLQEFERTERKYGSMKR